MAWSSAELSAAEIANRTSDYPMLSAITSSGNLSASRWVTGSPNFASTDDTEPYYPARFAVDGKSNLITKPDTTASNWALLFDFGASGIEFDWFGCVRHDLADPTTNSLSLKIDDASDFSGATTILTITPSSHVGNHRFAYHSLFHTGSTALRYSGVRYVAVHMTTLSPNSQPFIGEVVFGRRYQLPFKSRRPHDPYHRSNSVDRFETATGVIYDCVNYEGRFNLNMNFDPYDDAAAALFTDWHAATKHGKNTFAWTEDPSSAPHQFTLLKDTQSELELVHRGPVDRGMSIRAVEQGPFLMSAETFS